MKVIFLNSDYQCSVTEKSDTVQSVETDAFDGKCNTYIEGFRFIPEGRSWTRKDGVTFTGEMITPFQDFTYLKAVQALYEEMQPQVEATEAQAVYTAMMTDTLITE